MPFIKYGKTFQNEKDMNAYGKMRSESRKKALSRMTSDDKERASIRSHFRKEAKSLGIK